MIASLFLLFVAEPVPAPDQQQARVTRRGDWVEAYDARRDGRILPLREIERRVVPTMAGAQYLGVELDADTGVYTLKFLRDGTVIWVDVDGRSGQVIRKVGR